MNLSVRSSSILGTTAAAGWAGDRTLTIDRPVSAGGNGLGYSGGELLFLAIAACVHNDIYREAALMGISIDSVEVEVSGEFAGDPVRAQDIAYTVRIESSASDAAIAELIRHTDRVAEIPNSLRLGSNVRLASG